MNECHHTTVPLRALVWVAETEHIVQGEPKENHGCHGSRGHCIAELHGDVRLNGWLGADRPVYMYKITV